MNTEPPEGDELQRMLVSMKRNVLDRAAPRPKRRRVRPGIAIGIVGLLAIGTATGAVALSLSQQDRPVAAPVQTQEPEPAPSATTPTSAPITASPTPRPTPTQNTVANIPTDCRALVPAADYDRLFGDTPVTETTPGEDAPDAGLGSTSISCLWRDPRADISGISIQIGTGSEADLAEAVRMFPEFDGGGRCEPRGTATFCQSRGTVEGYGVEKAYTYYVRGTTWIVIDQTNVPTENLLGSLSETIWGD
ncbi:hypothetical protein [Curtobacterium sp. L1-20]|uniref:hypothetical protein n=1 Tax=Curtobacterium sp. L1-20 TaxID=3138181 RepID=UPI003B516638